MNQKHHWIISNKLKIQWCFFVLCFINLSCKSIKTDHKSVEKPTEKIEVLAFSSTKTDSFLLNNQAECKIIMQHVESKKANIFSKNKVFYPKSNTLEIPQIPQNQTYDDGRLHDGFSIASLVVGILGVPFYGKILGPIAIVLGVIGLFRSGKYKSRSGKGYAIAGIVLGIAAIVASFIIKNL